MADSTSAGNGPKVAAGTAGPNGTGAGATDAAASSTAGIPFYEQQRKQLKELILRRRALEKKLVRFFLVFWVLSLRTRWALFFFSTKATRLD